MTIKHEIRVDLYRIVADAVDTGVAYGTMRAFKHTDTPTHDAIKEEVTAAVMLQLCEALRFDDEAEPTEIAGTATLIPDDAVLFEFLRKNTAAVRKILDPMT
jgi:Ni,Fe-hydrogenase maturation factor